MEIREASLADIPKIISLLKVSLGENLLPKSEAFWTWKHIDNPFGESLVILAEDNGEVVGVRAFMKWEWVFRNRVLKALRAVDTAVHPSYQGRGIFTKTTKMLVDKAKNEGYDFVFNTPNKKSIKGYYKMGWEKFGNIPVTIQFNKLAKSIEPIDKIAFDKKLFFECLKKIKAEPNGIVKNVSPDFLEWRYFKCPVHNYHFITDRHSFLMIYRIRQTTIGKELRVVDVFYLKEIEKMDLELVSRAIEKTQKDLQVNYTSILGSNHGYSLKGFLTFSKIPIGPVLTIKDLNLKNLKPDIFAKSNWSYTLGDMELF
ncbi:GNAT family N-acetyltransferase [Belliella sp. DSM 107340]|uniref:GNAT family N-acetyltransferase n=1 Tax=Belliella calami TaxID=2923436 RepID=A0ABS9UJ83_9BACT|nr:GNAT family N-acetyltransferase [Belliella calami]MCH7396671.1 GNAT family N-acetyltransferase [Belliella calami]